MVAAPFRYERVTSFDEAVRALRERGEEAKVIAGGQSLVPMLNLRVARPDWLIDINPGGELPCVAVALGAEVTVQGRDGPRDLAVRDLLVSYLTTALEPEEVITEVRVPTQPARSGWSFLELTRRSSDWMVVGVAALVELDAAGAVAGASVAIGGVADRPWLVPAEPLADLLGAAPEEALIARVADRAGGMLDPEDDVHASGAYRQRMAAVLCRRALAEAVGRARANRRLDP